MERVRKLNYYKIIVPGRRSLRDSHRQCSSQLCYLRFQLNSPEPPPSVSHLLGSTYMKEYTAFFYGTLMHPKILKAVIRNDGSHLRICSAVILVRFTSFSPGKVCWSTFGRNILAIKSRWTSITAQAFSILFDEWYHSQKADYPGVVPFERGKKLFSHALSQEEKSVRGTLVEGLTEKDIEYLDIFEGEVSLH